MSYEMCLHGKACGYDICTGEECEHFRKKPEMKPCPFWEGLMMPEEVDHGPD